MNLMPLNLGLMVVCLSILTLVIQRMHFMMALLSLEAMMLGLFFLLGQLLYYSAMEIYLSFILLTFSACEACLGLALLVSLARMFGKDYLSIISLHKC
uniref:NADH-ubiquinone oxidoreductase chain 4L n=1 Tax=Phoronis psammophila TaxID=67897 RepID=Q6UKF5_9BILA|nr:NADH dehydrogenase subunit 4L [Phoronis architecta]